MKTPSLVLLAASAISLASPLSAQKLAHYVPKDTTPMRAINRITVITGEEIRARNISSLDELFTGLVPGIIATGDGSGTKAIWRARGSSGIGISNRVRVFLNGVELEDPNYISLINPEYVARIEITPGLAGSARLGATGAIIRIATKGERGDSTNLSSPDALLPAGDALISTGREKSLYGKGSSSLKRHAVNLTGGTPNLAYFTGLGYTGNGEYAPFTKSSALNGITSLSTTSKYVSARVFGMISKDDDRVPTGRYWVDSVSPGPMTSIRSSNQRTNNHVYGGSISANVTKSWHHELSAGFSRRRGQFKQEVSRPFDDSSINSTYDVGSDSRRETYSYLTSLGLPKVGAIEPTITAGIEQTRFERSNDSTYKIDSNSLSSYTRSNQRKVTSRFAEFGLFIAKSLQLDLGVRSQRDHMIVDKDQAKGFLPYAAVAYRAQIVEMSITPRFAYGALKTKGYDPLPLMAPSVNPPVPVEVSQKVSNIEGGVDVAFKSGPSFGITLYKQAGRDGTVNPTEWSGSISSPDAINRSMIDLKTSGVELSSTWANGPWDTRATFSLAKSVVGRVHDFYLPPPPQSGIQAYELGDALSDYPRQNGSLWIGHSSIDSKIGFEARYLGPHSGRNYLASPTDARLVTYPGFVTYNVNYTRPLADGASTFVYVQNLTNAERYGTSNQEYVRGRRFGIGFRMEY